MSFFDVFESRFLFRCTRGLALLLIFGLLAGIAAGAYSITTARPGTFDATVWPREVVDRIKPVVAVESAAPGGAAVPARPPDPPLLPGIKMPFALQKHFSAPDNLRVLRGWLDTVPAEHRQAFLDEMAAVVAEAERQKLDTAEAMNQFNTLKQRRLEATAAAETAETAALARRRLYYAYAATSAVVLIALCSLILVLLAIERNTRRVAP